MASIETIQVKGPAGLIKINAVDLDKYKEQGYEVWDGEEVPVGDPEGTGSDEGGEDDPPVEDED